jgi:hypothetical protein
MANNPLQKYFRQPKIFINLPSLGVYTKEGTLTGDPINMPVYGMTGMDEIIVKTPDALMTGESTVKVVESCCPTIKDAWGLSVLDTDVVFAAIRIATYGNILGLSNTCTNCGTSSDYDSDLNKIIDHFAACKYDNTIIVDNLTIKTQPLTYRQSTDFSLKNYELQQKLAQIQKMEDNPERQHNINLLWQELAESQKNVFSLTIESVEVEGVTVTERGFINEWLANCDKKIVDAIKDHIEINKQRWAMPKFPIKCENCGHETALLLDLDQSNFFELA